MSLRSTPILSSPSTRGPAPPSSSSSSLLFSPPCAGPTLAPGSCGPTRREAGVGSGTAGRGEGPSLKEAAGAGDISPSGARGEAALAASASDGAAAAYLSTAAFRCPCVAAADDSVCSVGPLKFLRASATQVLKIDVKETFLLAVLNPLSPSLILSVFSKCRSFFLACRFWSPSICMESPPSRASKTPRSSSSIRESNRSSWPICLTASSRSKSHCSLRFSFFSCFFDFFLDFFSSFFDFCFLPLSCFFFLSFLSEVDVDDEELPAMSKMQ
mmetsp:Transcript_16168/g.34992  ORF Transcript_16168/g.34992 Transcript_16168/m.34992 type:complete len:271 (+) Transcript_16168:556-1368(+)